MPESLPPYDTTRTPCATPPQRPKTPLQAAIVIINSVLSAPPNRILYNAYHSFIKAGRTHTRQQPAQAVGPQPSNALTEGANCYNEGRPYVLIHRPTRIHRHTRIVQRAVGPQQNPPCKEALVVSLG